VQWHYGIDNSLIRYNRVDALDAGVMLSRDFGSGYTGDLTARVSTGGPEFYGEAHFKRSDGSRTYDLGLYRRLAFANDWGDPLTFRASLNAFVLGQDLGFYYNTWGAELRSVTADESRLTWRLFAEQQSNAPVTTNVSIPNWFNGHDFTYNVQTPMTNTLGAQVRYRRDWGLDPQGFRESLDGRVEGALGKIYDSTYSYGRVALDGTITHPITRWLTMQVGGGAGTSVGTIPPQRDWFLGGAWTIRGQQPGTAVGNAYWMGHVELGSSFAAVRPTIFFDIGWAGDRNDWQHIGVPVSGAGAGVSFMDGLFRIDLAHAIQPTGGWILDFGTGTRF
jgi:outer membrane protein assembly factor BamA